MEYIPIEYIGKINETFDKLNKGELGADLNFYIIMLPVHDSRMIDSWQHKIVTKNLKMIEVIFARVSNRNWAIDRFSITNE